MPITAPQVRRGKNGTQSTNALVTELVARVSAELAFGPVLPTYAVAGLPAAADNAGRLVRCSNGAAGQPCIALSDGTNWKVVALGANVSAT